MFGQTLCRTRIHGNDIGARRLKIFDTGHELTDLPRTVWALISRESAEHQQNNGTLPLHCSEFDLLAGRSSQFEVWRLSADRRTKHCRSLPWSGIRIRRNSNEKQRAENITNRHDELPH